MILPATPAAIARAAAILNAGGIVAVPTETVYGLAARASDGAAVARIYNAKGRPAFNPLIVHVKDRAAAAALVVIDPVADRLIEAFWPGPLTIVLPLRTGAAVASLVTAGLTTLAVRSPAHPVLQSLIAATGPLAAPSANPSGRLSPTRAAHVEADFGTMAPVIVDGGPSHHGIESTIMSVSGGVATLLRPGAIASDAIRDLLAPTVLGEASDDSAGAVIAPGMLAGHYAPGLPLRLNASHRVAGEFHIGFGRVGGDTTLSAAGDVTEAAVHLFDLLHVAESSGRWAIAVAPIPETGLGAAINDRLRRAAIGAAARA